MDAVALVFRGEVLRTFALGERPLEVGSGRGADVVVHDEEVAERHCLVSRDGGEVRVFDLRPGPSRAALPLLVAGRPLALGRHHALLHVPSAVPDPDPAAPRTELIPVLDGETERLRLVVGRGEAQRTIQLGRRPITIGASPAADLVLNDRAVSGLHARVEPARGGLVVRDLGSRNGTFVDGVRAVLARLARGTRLRLGRTDLSVLACAPAAEVRGVVAASDAMRAVLDQAARIARHPWPALVVGESGVGKEGVARLIHDASPRRHGPFVAVNAGGLPRELVESELFGHVKGAFTGAATSHRGVFEQASGGTLFLDEIGELSLELQARLLRVIETGEIRKVGGEAVERVDVRLVCATHRDLRARAREGAFRLDLYYRIAQVVLEIPRLVERPEDIAALAQHFLRESEAEIGPRSLSDAALRRLLAHGWPGNVRELKSVVRSAALETAGQIVDADDVARAIGRLSGGAPSDLGALLTAHDGNISAAARSLGLPRSTLRDRLRKREA
jgi:transcriptional regulator with AAA-type ATPase domain